MAFKLQVCCLVLFANGIAESLGMWQNKMVIEGDTLTLNCPIRNGHRSDVEWKNPSEYVMFFNHQAVVKDRRYSIVKLAKREFTVQVSDVNFKDGGIYTCLHYHHRHNSVTTKRVKVTVLGTPKLEVTKYNGRPAIKCSAEGNGHAPKLSWHLGNGLEITAPTNFTFDKETSKYSSESALHIQSWKETVTVRCLVHHPALDGPMDSGVEIRLDPNGDPPAETPTEIPRPTTQRSTETSTAPYLVPPSTQRSERDRPRTEESPTTTGSYLTTLNHPDTTASDPTENTSQNDISNSTTTSDWLPASETIENTFHNETAGNSTHTEGREERNAPLLVFLVTCLIFGLLVVVVFFAIKLRRAHIIWKKENEDSDQSVESSRSKSNHEDTHAQERLRRGPFNFGFTKYVIEDPKDTKTEEAPETRKAFQARETEL